MTVRTNPNNDTWLHALRSDPTPAFEEQLRARLRTQEPEVELRRVWPRRTLACGAAVVASALLVAVPAVRASVAQFVSLFRVVNVVAVPVDSSRLDRLQAENLEIGTLIGEHIEVVQDPGPPVSVASLADAATAAGLTVAVPRWLPDHTQLLETVVAGERVVRVTANSQRLQQVMDALGINDLAVPAGLDGQIVNVRVPPVVTIRYDHSGRRTRLVQARAPQIALPDSIDVRALGEIGLRILGLPPADARTFAESIDWHTTMIVPVPPNASSFRQVTINGHRGVVIEHHPRNGSLTQTIIWSTPERVFALLSTQEWDQALAMADSVR